MFEDRTRNLLLTLVWYAIGSIAGLTVSDAVVAQQLIIDDSPEQTSQVMQEGPDDSTPILLQSESLVEGESTFRSPTDNGLWFVSSDCSPQSFDHSCPDSIRWFTGMTNVRGTEIRATRRCARRLNPGFLSAS